MCMKQKSQVIFVTLPLLSKSHDHGHSSVKVRQQNYLVIFRGKKIMVWVKKKVYLCKIRDITCITYMI